MPNDQWTYQTASAYVDSRLSEWKEFDDGTIAKPPWLHEMADRMLCCWCWMKTGQCLIRDRAEKIVPLLPNHAQTIVFAAMLKQACAGQPIRVCVPKSRKHGVSTFVQALGVFLCEHYPNQKAVTIAHESDATDEIFAIAKRAAQHYGVPATIKMRSIDFVKGSTYSCQTAGGTAVGAGGTPNILHISELAKWEKNKDETEYNASIAVPDTPTSVVVKESTLKGRDLFWKRCEEAQTPHASYAFVFLPWFIDPACEDAGDWVFDPTDAERGDIATARTYGIELSRGQLAWRRRKVSELGLAVVRQEYPSTPEEALTAYEGLILPDLRPCIVDTVPFDVGEIPNFVGGIDFGFNDPTVIWRGVLWDQCLYLIGYYRRSRGLARDWAEAITARTTYWCDPAALQARRELQEAVRLKGTLRVALNAAPRRKVPGEDPTDTELRYVIRAILDRRLFILRTCSEQLLAEAQSYSWNQKTSKPDDRRGDEVGHYDSIDALRYVVMGSLRPVQAEKTKRPQAEPYDRRRDLIA